MNVLIATRLHSVPSMNIQRNMISTDKLSSDMIIEIAVRSSYDTMMTLSTMCPELCKEMHSSEFWIGLISKYPLSDWTRNLLPERTMEELHQILIKLQTSAGVYSIQSAYYTTVEELVYQETLERSRRIAPRTSGGATSSPTDSSDIHITRRVSSGRWLA